jgi:hypothetical protein
MEHKMRDKGLKKEKNRLRVFLSSVKQNNISFSEMTFYPGLPDGLFSNQKSRFG